MKLTPCFRLWLVLSVLLWSRLAAADVTAFVDVAVLPMDSERILEHRTVLVSGDRITMIGAVGEIAVPNEARRIDGRGRFLMPGVGEMHGHNPPLGSSAEYIANVYFLYVANGVTTVRGMLGWPGQLELRDRVNRGELLGPSLYLAGPSFSGASVPTPPQAVARVREQKAQGWDLLKVHPGVKREVYEAMARTADEVGIRFAGHIPADVGLRHAIALHQETVDHLDGYIEDLRAEDAPVDPVKLANIVQLTCDTGTWVVPTMALWETIIGAADLARMEQYPELRYMPAKEVERWRAVYQKRTSAPQFNARRAAQIAANRKVLLKALDAAGARIIFGTDAPQEFSVPGFSVHRELRAMVAAGMSPYAALRSATATVGDYLRSKDRFGTVAAGARADLVLLEANPLIDVGHFARRAGVMVRGRWLPESEIQAGLQRIAAGR